MIWKILILVAFVVLVALYLNERSWTKFFRDNGHWWQNHSDKWAKQAEDCLDLARRRFNRGLVRRVDTGEIYEVYGVTRDLDGCYYFVVWADGVWLEMNPEIFEPATFEEEPETPTEGPTYVYFDGKTYQTDETITATM